MHAPFTSEVLRWLQAMLSMSGARSSFPDPPIARLLFSSTRLAWLWLIVRVYLGWQWLSSGWGKIYRRHVGQRRVAQRLLDQCRLRSAKGKPPISYDWYRAFIQFMLDNGWYTWFAEVIMWGEFLIGLALIVGAFVGLAAFGGALLNWNFIMAGTASTNGFLFVLAIALMLAWKVAGWYGLDRWLLPLLGTPWTWSGDGPPPRVGTAPTLGARARAPLVRNTRSSVQLTAQPAGGAAAPAGRSKRAPPPDRSPVRPPGTIEKKRSVPRANTVPFAVAPGCAAPTDRRCRIAGSARARAGQPALLHPARYHQLHQRSLLAVLEQNGGLQVFGFPITVEAPDSPEGTFTVQYFERNRFELHPEKQAPYNVLLGRLRRRAASAAGPRLVFLPQRPAAGGLPVLRRNRTLGLWPVSELLAKQWPA